MSQTHLKYEPYPTTYKFHQQHHYYLRAIMGPFGCVDGETEFLTPFGWKRIDQYDFGDDVAEWDKNTNSVSFNQPVAHLDKPCDELYEFDNGLNISMALSAEHQTPLYNAANELVIKSAEEVASEPFEYIVPTVFKRTGGLGWEDYLIRLAVLILTRGYAHRGANIYVICAKTDREKYRIKEVLDENNIQYIQKEIKYKLDIATEFVIRKSSIPAHFDLTVSWYAASTVELNIFLDELVQSVAVSKESKYRFYSRRKFLIDIIQFAAHACGCTAVIDDVEYDRDLPSAYRVKWYKNPVKNFNPLFNKDRMQIRKVAPVNRKKYCFTTSTGFFLARRKGNIFITGNSGKSVACVEELVYIGMRQKPASDGVRYVRFGVLRATYPNLRTTTKKTLEEWLPSGLGRIKEAAPMEGLYRIPLPDGTSIHMELLLLAIETHEDVEKLKSTNFTAVWINEATEVHSAVIDAATARVGRYPSGLRGRCSWAGILLDYNKPPRGHWLHELMSDEKRPEKYRLYVQPPAAFKHVSDDGIVTYTVNMEAENLHQVGGADYYYRQIDQRRAVGNTEEIDQLLCLLDTDEKRGKPVWKTFDRMRHVSKSILQPIHGADVLVAIDTSGIHPAALLAQFTGSQWVILDELYGEETGFENFVHGALVPLLRVRYASAGNVVAVCDPANARNSYNATTPVMNLQAAGIAAKLAPTNQLKARLEAVSMLLNRAIGGALISPNCEMLIAACAGKYHYKKLAIRGTVDEVYSSQPEKNDASHIADAFQYLALYVLKTSADDSDYEQAREEYSKRLSARRRII